MQSILSETHSSYVITITYKCQHCTEIQGEKCIVSVETNNSEEKIVRVNIRSRSFKTNLTVYDLCKFYIFCYLQ
jgi:hypothetical protein